MYTICFKQHEVVCIYLHPTLQSIRDFDISIFTFVVVAIRNQNITSNFGLIFNQFYQNISLKSKIIEFYLLFFLWQIMSLIRCTQLLSRKNTSFSTTSFLNVFKQSSVYYSDDKKSSDDGASDEVTAESKKQKKSFSPESQNKLNELLKKLSSRSTLKIVKEVQGSKPRGYKNIRQTQKLDAKEQKPRNVTAAAKAVSQELGEESIQNEILEPFGEQRGTEFLE